MGARIARGLVAVLAVALAGSDAAQAAVPVHVAAHHGGSDFVTFTCQFQSPAQCYGPTQIRAAYGIARLPQTGAGQTIAIVAPFQSPTLQQDLDSFDANFAQPAATVDVVAPDGLTPFDQNDADQTNWAGTFTPDVEWAHAIAPGAQIEFVSAKSDSDADVLSAFRYAVVNRVGDVIELNMDEPEGCIDAGVASDLHAALQAAADEDITVLVPTGDDGAAQPTCDHTSFEKAVTYPATDPLVTAVGGTRLDANGTTGAYNGEAAWNEPNFGLATGGGFSAQQPLPEYQAGLVAGQDRGVPDVSSSGAIIGGELGVWSTSGFGPNLFFLFGGTSLAAAQWAGLVALADERAGVPLGLIDPRLYQLAGDPAAYAADFHDVTTGDNSFTGTDSNGNAVTVQGYLAGAGWDPTTGLGTPKADALVPALAKDLVAPVVTCGKADGVWHTANVSIPCTATDDRALADRSQASFTLHTSVPAGQKDANAQTNSVEVCDKGGNCTVAGPVGGNMVDLTAPAAAPGPPAGPAPTCTAHRELVVRVRRHFKLRRGVHLTSARVFVDGRLVQTVRGRKPKATIDLAGNPSGAYEVSILARDSAGKSHRWTKTYRACPA